MMRKSIVFFLGVFLISTYVHLQAQDAVYLFAHGLGGSQNCAHAYYYNTIMQESHTVAFDGPEVVRIDPWDHSLDKEKIYMGQKKGVDALVSGFTQRVPDHAEKKVIGVGLSMGGATIINAAALHPNLFSALVIDSTFAHAKNVALDRARMVGLDWVPGANIIASFAMRLIFPAYRFNGLQPITSINRIPDIPIIILHSRADRLIPHAEAESLYQERVRAGMKHTYLVLVDSGYHANIFGGTPNDCMKIIKAVHAFYKQYGLTHQERLAEGVDLNDYQPGL